ncbi:MAG: tetratricopeptide repeat protein [Bacteroidales bacterium]|nr:tetratricopeptide repeat protein [Bacteroidales bacterium]
MKQPGICLLILLLLSGIVLNGQISDDKTDSLLIALQTAKTPNQKIGILIALSEKFSGVDNLKSYKFAYEAHLLAKNENAPEPLWKSCDVLSKAYFNLDSISQSNRLALEALNIGREMNDREKIALSLQKLGGKMLSLGSYSLAGEYLFEGLDYYEIMQDTANISTIYILLGIIHYKLDNPQKALDYYRKGLDFALATKNQVNISAALNNIAAVYEKLNEYDQALYYFGQALEINQQQNNTSWIANNYLNIGIVNYHREKYNESLSLFHKAISLFNAIQDEDGLAIAWSYLGKTHYRINNADSAYYYAKKSLHLSQENNISEVIVEASEFLSEYFDDNGSRDSATFYTILEYQTRDSLNEKEYLLQISKLEQQYDFQKQQQTLALQQQRKDFIKILFIGGLAAGLLIIVLLYSRLRIRAKHNKLQKYQLQRELEFKNQELTANVVALMKRNETISQLLIRLKTVEDSATKQVEKTAIRKISAELRNTTDGDILTEFELRFKEVHKDFYDKLIKTYPDLWPSELKLCAFLRLNMTTKEISELTGQTAPAIEKARYRLRQKLQIAGSDINLVAFLSAI